MATVGQREKRDPSTQGPQPSEIKVKRKQPGSWRNLASEAEQRRIRVFKVGVQFHLLCSTQIISVLI